MPSRPAMRSSKDLGTKPLDVVISLGPFENSGWFLGLSRSHPTLWGTVSESGMEEVPVSFPVLCPQLTLHPLSLFSAWASGFPWFCQWGVLAGDRQDRLGNSQVFIPVSVPRCGGVVTLGWPCPLTEGLCSSCHSRNHSLPLHLEVGSASALPYTLPTHL